MEIGGVEGGIGDACMGKVADVYGYLGVTFSRISDVSSAYI